MACGSPAGTIWHTMLGHFVGESASVSDDYAVAAKGPNGPIMPGKSLRADSKHPARMTGHGASSLEAIGLAQ
jgi:hypothetical protein